MWYIRVTVTKEKFLGLLRKVNVVFSNKFKSKRALVVNEKSLTEIVTLIGRYYPDKEVSIEATLKNGGNKKFVALDELFKYDNAGNYRIEELTIWFDSLSRGRLTFESTNDRFYHLIDGTTMTLKYEMEKKEDCISFEANLYEIIKKMRLPLYYTVLSRIHFFSIFVVVAIANGLFSAIYLSQNTTSMPIWVVGLGLAISFFISAGVYIIDKIRGALFPPIQFMLGDERQRLSKLEKVRGNIFWCIIVAFGVGLLLLLLPIN